MPVVFEEGYEFHLPDDRWFRFEDCETYRQLSGKSLKEMDFGWVVSGDEGVRQVWILEAKNIRGARAEAVRRGEDEAERGVDHLIRELVETLTDGMMLVASAWSGTERGETLLEEIRETAPEFPDRAVRLMTSVALRIDKIENAVLYDLLRKKVDKQLEGRLELMGSPGVHLAILRDDETVAALPITVESV